MKYYKIIKDKDFIGVITSENFRKYNPISTLMLASDENNGEYVRFNNVLYRDYWMYPIYNELFDFEIVSIIEITKEEYDTLHVIIQNEQEIPREYIEEQAGQSTQVVQTIDENDNITINFAREQALKALSAACRETIEQGFDITLKDGEVHHFSLDTQDQLNLITLSAMAETSNLIPYHADGELCKFYSSAEIKEIVAKATQFKIYHTTYYNALKAYVNSLETIEDIAAVTYGMDLPETYKTDVYKAII